VGAQATAIHAGQAEAVEEALSEYEEELSTEVDQGELTDF
jgi:hypothetical protein